MYRTSRTIWITCLLALAAGLFTFRDGALQMWEVWRANEEYGHAYFLPLISLFLVWQRKNELAEMDLRGSFAGVGVMLFGILLGLVGQLAAVYTVQQIGLMLSICGFVIALTGWPALRVLWMPLLLLFLMIPLPQFLQVNLSAGMQLVSSSLGVWLIRLLGISVHLEGNVIDLGTYKLQVVEACDGLRYLFPLMTLGLVMAYFFHGPFWKRATIFLSSIPITIAMNSVRIAMIGWTVEYWGPGAAEGFIHSFQGWAIFMASLAVIVLLMVLLSAVGKDRRPWRETFGLELPEPVQPGAARRQRPLTSSVLTAMAMLLVSAPLSVAIPNRVEAIPTREPLLDFPMTVGGWLGERKAIDPEVIRTLKFTDYVLADYQGPAPRPMNLYVAWYDSQRAGRSVHSPRTCLPGGGWQIVDFDQVSVPGVTAAGVQLRVNRSLMAMGPNRQLVYYWFQQRGRVVTSEYMAKWYLFWDSLTRNRSDGALVRLIAPMTEGEAASDVDRDLAQFAKEVEVVLDQYVPR